MTCAKSRTIAGWCVALVVTAGVLDVGAQPGSAFNSWSDIDPATHVSAGFVGDTLIGPVFGGASFGFDNATRVYMAIGQIFR